MNQRKQNLTDVVELQAKGAQIVIGLARLSYIRGLLEGGLYQVFAARSIGDDDEPATLVQLGAPIRLPYLDRFRDSGADPIDVIVAPAGMTFNEEEVRGIIDRMRVRREQKKMDDQFKATAIHTAAVELYRKCRALIDQAARLASDEEHIDPVTLQAVASIGEAVDDLLDPVSRAIRDLLNGGGGIFRAFADIPQPAEEEARLAILAALKAVQTSYYYNSSVRALGCKKSEQFPLFSTEDMERVFVATFFSAIGTWGGQGLEGHEDRSARFAELVCFHNANVPDIVEIVRAHGHTDWVNSVIYRTMVLTEVNDAESIHPIIISYQRDNVPGRCAEIRANWLQIMRLSPGLSGDEAKLRNMEVQVELLPPDSMRDVLAVALADGFVHRTEILKETKEQAIEGFTEPYHSVSQPRNPANGSAVPSIYGIMLAGLANTVDVIPERAVVEFRVPEATAKARMLGLDGGRAVCLSCPSENAADPLAPYLWLYGHRGLEPGQFLEMPVGSKPSVAEFIKLQSGKGGLPKCVCLCLGGSKDGPVYRRQRRLILWVMDLESYRHYFNVPIRLLPNMRQQLHQRADG